ncbi:FecCD family ABC transporter permease [Thermoanaerobacterium thermosaccharolyticum]|uniref:FecCD family ABC transporter permease n=1 Tax=Thermoanaerobacterium thermosaccharolyticum TaxID=1517 RepID=UPI0019DA95F6|nr:iron chelate uptake ABC transporter family permease subunit [Thermoanaerobacterium thermosaccharolyticum]MBE0227664.1 iron chelate uptake ABC transporter family permease subunit [Thermoanaerobacterium thermosaccharolyticum]
MKVKKSFYLLISIMVLIASLMFSASVGAVKIPLKSIVDIIFGGGNNTDRMILLKLRLPRIIEAAFTGMGLSVAGTFFQGLLKNPMADPYVLGISSGAAFGASIAIVLGLGLFGLQFMAFASALVTIYVVYMLSKKGPNVSMQTMLLAGIAISAFMSSIISLMMLLNHNEMSQIVFWTMGGFSLISWSQIFYTVPIIFIGCIALYVFSRDLNVMMTGEEIAEHLGIDTERVKKIILIVGSLITASSVSAGGIIGFVGLIVPHISRLIIGSDNRALVPFSGILGASFLVLADTLARIAMAPVEIPVGIITAAFGGPFFLYLLIKNKNREVK